MRKDYDMTQARRGAVLPPSTRKSRITIRLDTDVLTWFRDRVDEEGGGSYQTKINQALREYIDHHGEPLEAMLRRVVREELKAHQTRERRSA